MSRFPFDKFSDVTNKLGTQMKATGEVMSIGRTFEEIANICEDNNVMEWEVIEAMFDAIREEKIDISEWL